jgi:4-amino-4-deoxy-L-arabinose transferase-like glycosyltransferase
VQIVVSLVTVVLVYQIARRMFDERVAVLAAALWSIYPSFLYAGVLVLTEVLFTCLVLAACLSAALALRDGQHRPLLWALATGFCVGLAALTRSVVWPLPLVLTPLVAVCATGGWRHRISLGGAVFVGYLVAVAPWAIRNTALQRTFVVIDTMGGLNLRMGNYEYTIEDRMWDGVANTGIRAWSYEMVQEHPEATWWTEGQRERWARDHAVQYMVAHPGITFRRAVIKFADFWGLEREYIAALRVGAYQPPLWFKALSSMLVLFGYVLIALLACFGIFEWRSGNWRAHVVPVLFVVWICALHSIVFGHSRYHLPLMPVLTIYAAAALASGSWHRLTAAVWQRRAAFAVAGVFACIWLRELLLRDFDRIRGLLQQ